jgi:phage-related protein
MSMLPDIKEIRQLTQQALNVNFDAYFNALNAKTVIGAAAAKGKTTADCYLYKITKNEAEYKPFLDYLITQYSDSGYKISLVVVDVGGFHDEYTPAHLIRFDWS